MIGILGAKRQQHKEMEKTWAKAEKVLQKAKRNILELVLKKRRTLPRSLPQLRFR
jgi:hypothetical protein